MNRIPSALFALAALCIAPSLAHAQDAQDAQVAAAAIPSAGCAGAASLSPLQARIVEKAAQGTVPLRQFVWRTRNIHQLDTMETVAWLDQRRALRAACEQRSAGIDPVVAASR